MAKDSITVYWAPSAYVSDTDSWSFAYSEPKSVKNKIMREVSGDMRICPAVKDGVKNLFSINSNLEEDFIIDLDYSEKIMNDKNISNIAVQTIEGVPKLNFFKSRNPEYLDHYNYTYNISWIFFAEESLEMRISSPYLPPSSPIKGSFLPTGTFNIGEWYRPVNLEYITPKTSDHFQLSIGEELVYLQFLTDKTINFKQYFYSDRLDHLARETSDSPKRYSKFKNLKERYQMARRSHLKEKVLSEIKKNLIE